jgi:hypothetical protein
MSTEDNLKNETANDGKPLVMCRAGDFVKEAGGDWIKVLRVEGRNIYLDYGDGLNCLDIDDVIAWKHGT